MDVVKIVGVIKDLGIPAVLTAIGGALVSSFYATHQKRSKQSLLEWLSDPHSIEPFATDSRAQAALQELRQSLTFERAFGVRADSWLRAELLDFAQAFGSRFRFREVLGSARLIARLSRDQLDKPRSTSAPKFSRDLLRFLGYAASVVGLVTVMAGLLLPTILDLDLRDGIFLSSVLVPSGLIYTLLAILSLRQARRMEILAAFGEWHLSRRTAAFP